MKIRRATAYNNHNSTIISLCTGNEAVFVHDVLYPLYSFLQLYVIYKFGNVIVNKNKILARFAFMHCIGASLCFWIYTIKNETLDSYITKYFSDMKMPFAEDECEDNEDDLRYTYIFEAQIILSGM